MALSTLPFTEVAAQTITPKSGTNQSAKRGEWFSDPVTFTLSGTNGTPYSIEVRSYQVANMISSLWRGHTTFNHTYNNQTDGDLTFYVKVPENPLFDTISVRSTFVLTPNERVHTPGVVFIGKVTDVLNFPASTVNRRVDDGTLPNIDIGAPVPAAIHYRNVDTDPNNDVVLRYSLEGRDASSFSIDTSTGQLKTKDPLDYDTKNVYSVTVRVRETSNSSDTIDVLIYVEDDPNAGIIWRLNVQRIDDQTVKLCWDIPTTFNADTITEYHYSIDDGQTWTSTGSTNTCITLTQDGIGDLPRDQFKIRATDGRRRLAIISAPQQRIIHECPVGWVRSDGFAQPTQRVLLYEVKLDMDLHNRISIYKPDWVAIYVHPDEALENLDGWKLQVAVPYNHHRDYLLTAENSVVVDANIEGVEGGFAFIENPEEDPFPMVGMGFTGALVPGFDYRLYDDTGRKVDFGIACYKQGGIFQTLKDMEDPRVLRNVLLESLDWDAATYIRSEWTVPAPAPAAPSLVKKTIVGTWANLKKQ